ncbi:MAG: hypothetical protein A3J83_00265 [Elusimicrobia bacterium RIFOXYA2_FULL_40_6]|nr:MAG: hypothetical protein A3J83_00265 [Elusimicrobia bacterium RIFOXYA2_FULL_40_6]
MEKINYPVEHADFYKLHFDGFKKGRVCAWYVLPRNHSKNMPAILEFHGYNSRKGCLFNTLPWVLQGYAVLVMDIRGQLGESTDEMDYPLPNVPKANTWLLKGILDPFSYYYRYVYVDCVRALDFLLSRKEIDKKNIIVWGTSQGGGLAMALSGLCPDKIKTTIAHMPFLCDFQLGVKDSKEGVYQHIVNFLKAYPKCTKTVFNTLSYFDCLNFADKIKSRILVTVGMKDPICPPSSIFSAYKHIRGNKQLAVYNFLGHDFREFMADQTLFWVKNIPFESNRARLVYEYFGIKLKIDKKTLVFSQVG